MTAGTQVPKSHAGTYKNVIMTHVGCVRDMSGGPKSRTELKIGGSGAKNCAEHHGNVRFGVAPQKPTKNCKKPILKSICLAIVKFGKKR